MQTFSINQPIRMTNHDVTLLESAINGIIHTQPTRTRVTCDPRDFSKFSSMWNSYRDCLKSSDPINMIKEWRKGIEQELDHKFYLA